MATALTGTEIVAKTRSELGEDLFESFFESVIEQSEMSPDQIATLAEYVDPKSEAPAVLVKRDQLAAFVHRWEAESAYLRSQETLLADRRRAIEKFIDGFKSGMLMQFLNWGIRKVEGRTHRFSLRKNPPRVEVFDETLLPTEFIRYTAAPDKAAIKDAIEAGKDVPGARLAEETQRLEIK